MTRCRCLTSPTGRLCRICTREDANGIQMLAHTPSRQGVSAIENICGRTHVVDHESMRCLHAPGGRAGLRTAWCERAEKEGFVGKAVARLYGEQVRGQLAEGEGDGIAKVLFRRDTEQILGVHIIGQHAADLIQECANAKAA